MDDTPAKSAPKATPAESVKKLLREARKASLATLDRQNGGPYASLVTLATAADGAPLMLISRLAIHTQNILSDPRSGLLIDGTSPEGDPLAGGRVSLMGRVAITENANEKRRFLARHPEAEMYAAFTDFAFYPDPPTVGFDQGFDNSQPHPGFTQPINQRALSPIKSLKNPAQVLFSNPTPGVTN